MDLPTSSLGGVASGEIMDDEGRKCIEKEVRLPYRKGKKANHSVVREHYLRKDISCKAEKCCICNHHVLRDAKR